MTVAQLFHKYLIIYHGTIKMYGNCGFKIISLTLPISSKLGGDVRDYGLDGYCKTQVAMDNRPICA